MLSFVETFPVLGTFAKAVAVSFTGAAVANLAWPHTETDDKYVDATDVIHVLAYNPDKKKFIRVSNAATRSAMSYNLQPPANFVGDNLHLYVAFGSTKQKMLQSETLYLGSSVVV